MHSTNGSLLFTLKLQNQDVSKTRRCSWKMYSLVCPAKTLQLTFEVKKKSLESFWWQVESIVELRATSSPPTCQKHSVLIYSSLSLYPPAPPLRPLHPSSSSSFSTAQRCMHKSNLQGHPIEWYSGFILVCGQRLASSY